MKSIIYAFKRHWRVKKSTVICCVLAVVMRVAVPFIGILLPKIVIDELTAGVTPVRFMAVIGGMTALLAVVNYLKQYTDEIVDGSVGTIAAYTTANAMADKQMDMDYELMEDPDVKILEDKADKAGGNNHTPAHNIPGTAVKLLVNVAGFFLYGSVIASVHPVIIVLLGLSAAVNWLMLSWARRYEKKTREERSKVNNKVRYLYKSMKDKSGAKDIRLYGMAEWLDGLASQWLKTQASGEYKVSLRNMLAQMTDALLILIRDGAAYAFLIYLLLNNRQTLGDFVFIFAAIGAFAGWVSGIIVETSNIIRASGEMDDMRAYFDNPDRMNTGPGAALPPPDQAPAITLKNVCYTYPKADEPALSDINLVIKPGERIAVVGANGAGKTTLVKLICGLYTPKEGHIFINDSDIKQFNRDEYYRLFTAVFQDIHLLAENIETNVSQTVESQIDHEKVIRCLQLSGMYEKVQKLPHREKTLLVREVNDDAVEFSGGEKQKLALARALYKAAPIMILDEPTAALDPIAESEVYQQYAALTKNKTSIYISHRLASTRFCDRILFIDRHTIAESGTHEELMKLGGQYARMFEIQSHYYQADAVAKEA